MLKYITIFLILTTSMYSQGPTKYQNKDIESWYFHIALGLASPSYYDELQKLVDIIAKNSDSHHSINFDIGFYFTLEGDKGILGGTINGVGDRFESSGEWIQINQYLIGPSFVYYATNYIGKGLFFRGDLGLAYAVAHGSSGESRSTDTGIGYLFGAGFAIPLNNETRLQFYIDYSGKTVKEEQFNAFTFNLGFLF